jgi:hypothetical protein
MMGLEKNVWLLYNVGYYGSYINWGLKISHPDLRDETISNPLMTTGSSHHLLRIPTHQAIDIQAAWLYNNRPKHKVIIPVSTDNSPHGNNGFNNHKGVAKMIFMLDNDPFVINIWDGGMPLMREIAQLNQVDKWPVAGVITSMNFPNLPNPWSGDPIAARRFLATSWNIYFDHCECLDIEVWRERYDFLINRINARKSVAIEGEITDEQYPYPKEFPKDIYSIDLNQILRSNFVDWFAENIDYKALGNLDLTYWREFHKEKFIPAQKAIRWPKIKSAFFKSGTVDPYLHSNRLADAFIFEEAIKRYGSTVDFNWTLEELADFVTYRNTIG